MHAHLEVSSYADAHSCSRCVAQLLPLSWGSYAASEILQQLPARDAVAVQPAVATAGVTVADVGCKGGWEGGEGDLSLVMRVVCQDKAVVLCTRYQASVNTHFSNACR